MPKVISEESIRQVIICRFEGKSRQETCQKTGVSETKIQQIWNDFRSKIGQANFDTLTKIGEFASSKGISFVQWTDEFCIRARLDSLGIKTDESLGLFFEEVYSYCKEQKTSITLLIEEIIDLKKLSSQTGIPIGQMSRHFAELDAKTKQKTAEYNRASQNLSKINQEVKKAEKESTDKLAQDKVTQKNLNEYVNTRQSLEERGLSINDLPKTEKVITKLKKQGWSDLIIIDHLTEKSEHDEKIKQQQAKIDYNNSIISKQEKTKDQQKKDIQSNNSEILQEKSKIRTLQKQEKEIVQSLDIRHDLYKVKVQEFFDTTKKSIEKLQKFGADRIERTSQQISKNQEELLAKQRQEFTDLILILDHEIPKIIETVKKVSSLMSIEPINKLISLKSSPLETIQAAILVLELFVLMYGRNPKHNSMVLTQANSLLKYLKGEMKCRF